MTDYDILGPVGLAEDLFYVRVSDSNAIVRGHPTFEDHCFTVHDEEGLDALPVGAWLQDSGEGAMRGYGWLNTSNGWVYGGRGESRIFDTDSAWGVVGYEWQNVELGNSSYGPFALLNPEILGDLGAFAPEVDVPVIPSRFIAGQVVRLKCTMNYAWDGFLAEAISDDCQQVILKPLSPRPDRNGWAKFTWGVERVELVEDRAAA